MFLGIDSTYIMLVLPSFLLCLYAQYKVKSTFKKYLGYDNDKGITGAQVARTLLDNNGLNDVKIEPISGFLSDHYDPSDRVIRLSDEVYNGISVASVGVAAHETGHAIQHNVGYIPIKIRSALVPVAGLGSNLGMVFVILGLAISVTGLINLGIIIFSLAVAFQIVTLPVEFNASSRAIKCLSEYNILSDAEIEPTRAVLNAAALTYVAAAISAIANLIRLLVLANRRDD